LKTGPRIKPYNFEKRGTNKLSNLTKGLILVAVILAIGAGLVVWKKKVGTSTDAYNSISKHEIELLLADVAAKNPMGLKRLADDPEMKKKQLESLKQLLAFAVTAQREGYASEPNNRQELRNIRDQIQAQAYDQEINKDKGPMPPFGFITEDQMNQYWAEDQNGQSGGGFFSNVLDKIGLGDDNANLSHEAEFNKFIDGKIELMKQSNPEMAQREISDDERQQAKEFFAKVKIYQREYDQKAKAGQLSQDFIDKTNLQVKLQQAQYLARVYSEELAKKVKATDEDINNYIAQHPELDPKEKKAKAEEILARAKNGEDFAALANEFSEDPGNKNPKGEAQGGLYSDVQKGRMVKPFEDAALALEPGQIAPDVVESDFGYHIIKLEKKSDAKDASGNPSQTYDVRHILIATTYKDPENPTARPMPVKEYVRQKIEQEREKEAVDKIVENSGVTVAEDFEIPQVTDEQIQEMMKKQQPGPMMNPDDEEAPPPTKGEQKKPATKKGK
jgi:parvulin-like peptidyl-prolyl isomerase